MIIRNFTKADLMIEKAKQDKKDAVIECDMEQNVTKHIAEKFGFVYEGTDDGCCVFRLKICEKM